MRATRRSRFYYDGHNRLVGKTYHAGINNLDTLTCSGAYAVGFSYDNAANGNLGGGPTHGHERSIGQQRLGL
ncbi:hypothetical protein [Candidatus Amarobacter glycogenicus]|uniref:hypothetical protein n=1 Tax=Candidatus Amarobacter glycogenicus TaxID=3140699 RepID=UPI003134F34F|nr:hypothetical protein [Dehalococcoidia bacterium]